MADPQCSTLITKLGFGVLTFNSVLAIRNSWGDTSSVAFVLAAVAALVLLFLCLSDLERPGRGRDGAKKAAVWALTTLLTAMFAYKVVPLMPLAVGVLVFLCLGEVDKVYHGGSNTMAGQYSVLAKVGLAIVTCNAALDARRRDPSSAAFVLASFVCLVILIGFFVRAFAHAHAGEQEEH